MSNTIENGIKDVLKKGPMISEQIRDELMNRGLTFTPLEFREALADLVRKGEVDKYPSYEERKFYFRLRSDNF
ncbi:hypothetical protein [Metallosphaera cuprina]|uniref:Transcriptional regulator n=1 Tax=Metallosphaera cuprina (strain Ar-4) TaxID=1006006 RepID=F4FYA5_METCR|nr:hypothetical protein [Metallosphaera cuprina]AEB94224.1 conserved hypothetical protein [Metallosphaera cuprina Ar-4]